MNTSDSSDNPRDNPYGRGLDRRQANYTPLNPVSFLARTARTYPGHPALIDGEVRQDWGTTYNRCRAMAHALSQSGIGRDQTVAILAPNTRSIFESHFFVPMCGAVLNTINTRLDAATVGFILNHGRAQVFIVDSEYADLAREALAVADHEIQLIEVEVPGIELSLDCPTYEDFMARGDSDWQWQHPTDEWDAISLNYTSGTTGNPKGVVYHYRGAYLNALSNAVGWDMGHHPVYLWTLPMFHCNGWCFPWTLAAVAGTSVCIRQVNSAAIYDAIAGHGVTHFCGAPIIMSMVINATAEERKPFDHQVYMMTAAAPPPAAVLEAMEREGFNVTHVYGLTETYGPAVMCAWKSQWDELDSEARAAMKSRQGVPYPVLEDLEIIDPGEMAPVARDGETMGEAMFRGNIVMKGYLDNPAATEEAFAGGWFHAGDLGVMHDDGYIQLKDRSKDIIISGGENISSIEVENCLFTHPAVIGAAVVARPDDKWGETPCAFIELAEGAEASEQEIIDWCRERIARYKAPKTVVFQELPKTSTGKVQKFILRDIAAGL